MVAKRTIEQRKRIAKDVLAQLNAKRFIAEQGVYVSNMGPQPKNVNAKVQTPKQCNVCAIGSIFVSAVDRYNRLEVKDLGCYSGTTEPRPANLLKYLNKWWSEEEMRLIETAFEGEVIEQPMGIFSDDHSYNAWQNKAIKAQNWHDYQTDLYYDKYGVYGENTNMSLDEFLLRAICKKLIRSVDGSFRL